MRHLQAAGGTAITGRQAWAVAWAVGLAGYAADLATKTLALAYLDPTNPPVLLGGLLTLQLIRNPGAAFSLGEGFTPVLTGIAVVALVVIVGWFIPRVRHRGWAVAAGLLLAGVLGNLTDRLLRPPGVGRGHVIDFLQLPSFAIFNVADMCITFAAVTIIWLTSITQVGLDGRSTRVQPA